MTTPHIDALKQALAVSPENTALLYILLDALYQAGENQAALVYLEKHPTPPLDQAQRLLAGRLALAGGQPEKALEFCSSETPEELLLKAKAHLALFQNEQGLAAYLEAVARNPSLEEIDLERSLRAKVSQMSTAKDGNVVPLRILSGGENTEKDSEKTASASDLLKAETTIVTFADIGGLEDVKKQIYRKIVLPFQKKSLFEKFKKKAGGGILLYGPPGCGKTLLARATAGECEAQFYSVTISDVLDMWLGNSEKRLHTIFEQARRTAPSVLFFDEIEGLAGKRQFNSEQAIAKNVSQFLTEMDGFGQNNEGVLVLGATNVPWSLDSAFRRPGRFDRVLFVPPPDMAARSAILQILISEKPTEGLIAVDLLAKATSEFSGADLKHLVETGCDLAIEASLDQGKEILLSMAHLNAAIKEVRPTTTEWLTTANNYARYSNEGGQYDEILAFFKKHGK